MKKTFLAAAIVACGSLWVQAQQPFQHRCGYDHAVMQRNQQFPGYKTAADATFIDAQQLGEWLQRQGQRSLYVVPVAVHVVWKEAAENLSECKVLEQIDVLNEDYQRLNADTANMRAIFQGIAGNPQIQFRLDTIIWKQTNSIFYSTSPFPDIAALDKVKHDADGGDDALAVDSYLNIWICNMGATGILGYAYPPAGLAHWPANSEAPTPEEEGVVLDYRVVGRQGVYTLQGNTLYTQGRAASHEVGHYLGLRHIWGDGLSAIFGVPDCNATDGVNDTPTQGIGSNFACDDTQNTCNTGAGDLPDMIENFMDYSEESCQNSFTNGQIAIMHGVLSNERSGLALTPAPTNNRPANDALTTATILSVGLDTVCLGATAGTTVGATPSQAACQGSAAANDVWYAFNSPGQNLVLELSSLSSSDTLFYEVLSGSCGNTTSLHCGSTTSNVEDMAALAGLTAGQDYYVRLYSSNAMNFDVCVYATDNLASTNNLSKEDIRIFPNPSAGVFVVEITAQGSNYGTLELKNALGQTVGQTIEWDGNNANFQLDLSSQANGVYWLQINQNGQVVTRPLVVTK